MDFLSPDLANIDLYFFVRTALEQAELVGQTGELLIGAVMAHFQNGDL